LSSPAATWATDEKNGDSFTATGIFTACLTTLTMSSTWCSTASLVS
jgi:hypothetical protein